MASIFLFFSLPPHHHHSARLRRTPLKCSDRRVKDVETGRRVVDVFRIYSLLVFIPKANRHGYVLVILCSREINEEITLTAWSDTLCVSCTPLEHVLNNSSKNTTEQGQKLRWKQDLNLRGETPSDNWPFKSLALTTRPFQLGEPRENLYFGVPD